MPLTYSRVHIHAIDSVSDGDERISLAFSKGSREHAYLTIWLRVAIKRGYGYPYFEDGGSLISLAPSLSFRMASSRLPATN